MENYKNLKVELFRHKNVVLCEILQMDERLRGKGICYELGNFTIESYCGPQLSETVLYLRGEETERDNRVRSLEFDTEVEAIKYIERVQTCIKRLNNSFTTVLDEVEQKYLQKFVNMFPAEVTSIRKAPRTCLGDWYERIIVTYNCLGIANSIEFPLFDQNSMYQNMCSNKRYSLEELGLTQKQYVK